MFLIFVFSITVYSEHCNIQNLREIDYSTVIFNTQVYIHLIKDPCLNVQLRDGNDIFEGESVRIKDSYEHRFNVKANGTYKISFNQQRLLQTDNLNCYPYGQRLSLGYYYTYQNDSTDMMDLAFNTLANCTQGYIVISSGIFQNTIPVTEIILVNMTQLYENNSKYHYDYVTYTNVVRLGSQNIPGEDRLYNYTIFGNSDDFIGPFLFRIPPKLGNQTRNFIFFGDMDSNWADNVSNYTFNWLQARTDETSINTYDMLVFEGDMAYDLESQNCERGDYWLRNSSVFTKNYPFMIGPGNHDAGNNTDYPFYRRTYMSPDLESLNTPDYYNNFYSFDLGLAHFIFYNPYWTVYQSGPEIDALTNEILQVFEQDLIQAQANRANVPWIIVNSHYPMYCSDEGDYQCYNNHISLNGFAQLFTKYGVEMYMSAHQHNYERDAPFINNVSGVFTTDGPAQHLIQNSNAPVYIIEGAAGNAYFMASSDYPVQPYTVMQSEERGVGIITIYNYTHLLFQHFNSYNNSLIDYVMVVKDRNNNSGYNYTWVYYTVGFTILFMIIGLAIFLWRRQYLKKSAELPEQSMTDLSLR